MAWVSPPGSERGLLPPIRAPNILLVGDRDEVRFTTKWFLSQFGYQVQSVRTPKEALALFDSKRFDLVVTENAMAGMTGSEMAHTIKMRFPSTAVVMHTSILPEDPSSLDLILRKPTHLLALKDALESLLPHSPPPSPARDS